MALEALTELAVAEKVIGRQGVKLSPLSEPEQVRGVVVAAKLAYEEKEIFLTPQQTALAACFFTLANGEYLSHADLYKVMEFLWPAKKDHSYSKQIDIVRKKLATINSPVIVLEVKAENSRKRFGFGHPEGPVLTSHVRETLPKKIKEFLPSWVVNEAMVASLLRYTKKQTGKSLRKQDWRSMPERQLNDYTGLSVSPERVERLKTFTNLGPKPVTPPAVLAAREAILVKP